MGRVFQIGQQAIKPTKVGEISRGLQAFRAGQQQIEQQKQQQQLSQLKLQQLRAQIEQIGVQKQLTPSAQKQQRENEAFRSLPVEEQKKVMRIRLGLEPGPSVSDKPKKFDILTLNKTLFEITHDKEGEIEPSKSDLIALQQAAEQSGFELRKIPKTFPKVGRLGKVIPGTFIYRLVPKVKSKTGPSKPASKKAVPKIDVRQLTDEQLNAIIGSK